jgi:hypothetical protein
MSSKFTPNKKASFLFKGLFSNLLKQTSQAYTIIAKGLFISCAIPDAILPIVIILSE